MLYCLVTVFEKSVMLLSYSCRKVIQCLVIVQTLHKRDTLTYESFAMCEAIFIGVGRGGGQGGGGLARGGGQAPPIILEGGPTYPLAPQ